MAEDLVVPQKQKYQPRHTWYRWQAEELLVKLQAIAWPLNFHVAMGGSILNHGYADHDVDFYILPIYRKDQTHDYQQLVAGLVELLGPWKPIGGPYIVPGKAFKYQMQLHPEGKRVDIFVVDAHD